MAPRHLRATRSHQLRVTAANRCTSSPCARAPARRRRRRGRTILKISKKKMFKKSNKKFVLRIIRRRARIIFKTLSKLVQKIKQKISPRRPWISAHPHERIFAEVAARVQGRDGVVLAGGHQVHLPFRVGGRESMCPYLFTHVSVSFHLCVRIFSWSCVVLAGGHQLPARASERGTMKNSIPKINGKFSMAARVRIYMDHQAVLAGRLGQGFEFCCSV